MSVVVHILRPNGALKAPFSDKTMCGIPVTDTTSAYWDRVDIRGPDEELCRRCARVKE